MLEFFSKIGDLISLGINFVILALKNLVQIITMIPKAYAALVEALYLLPPFITVPLMGFVGVALAIAIISSFK